MSDSNPIGFIGLGAMGYGMARNVLKRGHAVLAYDVNQAPLTELTQHGARAANGVAAIGASCTTVMVMVVSGEQVNAVINPRDGLLSTMTSGTILVHSTIALSELRAIAEQAEQVGVTVIDCPVSGGAQGANEGTLTMLCGGDRAAFDEKKPLLDAVASNVAHLGPLGAGMVGKLANNLILGVNRLAIGEAFAMAKKAGLPLDSLFQAIVTCSADSRQLRALEGVLLRGDYPQRTFHGVKDLTAAVDSGRAVDQAMPVTALTRELYQMIDAKAGGLSGSDEVIRYVLEN